MTHDQTSAIPDAAAGADNVRGALTFTVPQETKPYFESAALTGGEPRVHFRTEVRRVEVRDMRQVADLLSLDREGFLLVRHATAVEDLYDDEAIADVYDRELEALLTEVTGADRVAVFDHTRRSDSAAGAATRTGSAVRRAVSTWTTPSTRGRSARPMRSDRRRWIGYCRAAGASCRSTCGGQSEVRSCALQSRSRTRRACAPTS